MVGSPDLATSVLMSTTPSIAAASAKLSDEGAQGGKLSAAAAAGLRRGMMEAVMRLSVTQEVRGRTGR